MRIRVDNAGGIGLVTDIDQPEVPPNVWTAVNNARMKRGAVQPFGGNTRLFTPAGAAHYLIGFDKAGTWTLCYPADVANAGAAETIYSFDGATETARTRSGTNYTAATAQWNGCYFHNVPIFTNLLVAPQYWTASSTVFADMVYRFNTSGTALTWDNYDDASHSYRAKVIRPFLNYLFALYIVDNGVTYPQMVHWSNAADPGTVPTSWNYADPTVDSGRVDLADTPGYLVDCLALHDSLVIYKEDAIWVASYVGGQYVFDLRKLSTSHGLLSQDCAVDIGGRHVCMDRDRVYVHDGHTITPILEGRAADILFSDIDDTNRTKSFLAINKRQSEVWICYPAQGASVPNRALVWNYEANTWAKRALPSIRHATTTWMPYGGASWPTASSTDFADWNVVGVSWDEGQRGTNFLGAGASLWVFDYGSLFGSATPNVAVERTGIQPDAGGGKWMLRGIYPRASGGPFRVQAGAQAAPDSPVEWQDAQTFTPGTDSKVDARITGEHLAVRFKSANGQNWVLSGYELDIEKVGER
jgi:hypothetical protein